MAGLTCPACQAGLHLTLATDLSPETERQDARCPDPDCEVVSLSIRRDYP
jgi:hypothetical protein